MDHCEVKGNLELVSEEMRRKLHLLVARRELGVRCRGSSWRVDRCVFGKEYLIVWGRRWEEAWERKVGFVG